MESKILISEKTKSEIVSTLRMLLRMEDVSQCYSFFMDMARVDGFDVFDAGGVGGHIDFWPQKNEGEKKSGMIGIPIHLDVVPAGEGWDFDPFGAELSDGKIYARGAIDNKGPAVASYFAAKLLKESDFEPKKGLRMIVGTDEETGWDNLEKYLDAVSDVPDMSFVPDGNFPLVFAEKGILNFQLATKLKKGNGEGITVSKIEGGVARNAVPSEARAVLSAAESKTLEGIAGMALADGLEAGKVGKGLRVTAHGKSAHASTPEKGENAISKLFAFLGKLNLASDELAAFVDFYNEHIGLETNGRSLGLELRDEKSGALTFSVGMVTADKNVLIAECDLRYPVTFSEETVYDLLAKKLEGSDIGIVKDFTKKPIYVDPESNFAKGLLSAYSEETGDVDSKPIALGGGTFARAFPNAVAFGPVIDESMEIMHEANECIAVGDLMLLTQIYRRAIINLDAIE